MRNFGIYGAVLASLFLSGGQAMGATASASATVVTPITVTKNVDLEFGSFSPDPGYVGTITLTPALMTARSKTGTGLTLYTSAISAAKFTITGTDSQTFTFVLPSSAQSMVGSVTGTMNATNFTSDLTSGTAALVSGSKVMYVGATLNVGANQVSGEYTGSFDVTVAYN